MQAGKLRHRITIQAPQTASDPFQLATAGTWNDIITVWARISKATQRDIDNAQAGNQSMQVSHVVTMRYPGKNYTVGAGYQLVYGTRVFQVLKGIVNDEERNIMLQLYVWEINPVAGG